MTEKVSETKIVMIEGKGINSEQREAWLELKQMIEFGEAELKTETPDCSEKKLILPDFGVLKPNRKTRRDMKFKG